MGSIETSYGDYFKQVQSMAAQLLLEGAFGDRQFGKQIENV